MSTRKPPRLFRSDLTGHIYITTSYTETADGLVVSNIKFDVTEDFEAIEAARKECRLSADGWCFTHSTAAGPVYCEQKT